MTSPPPPIPSENSQALARYALAAFDLRTRGLPDDEKREALWALVLLAEVRHHAAREAEGDASLADPRER